MPTTSARALDAESLAAMSLEELMQVEVTTVSGTGLSRFTAPAALFVLTADDIRRSGHRTLAEAMRLIPGMYVARINSSSWLVGARGLTGSSLTATRYLVLIDGRVVHDPLLSGTFWDVTDVMLEDIERIEVVRGPGATLWGVNAMNGVINIITASARDTQGTLVSTGAGDLDPFNLTVRHGGGNDVTSWRVWAKYAEHDAFALADGTSVEDDWSSARLGFRVDTTLAATRGMTVSGDLYAHPRAHFSLLRPVPDAHLTQERVTGNDDISGAHLLARIDEGIPGEDGWRAQAYVDHVRRDTARFGVRRSTLDVDWRRWRIFDGHEWIYGFQYTHIEDALSGEQLRFAPTERTWGVANAFLQDTIELQPEHWFLMLGSKLTHHDFVGWDLQPSVRLWWTPSSRQTFWAAVSRPVRVPSRLEEDGSLVFNYVDTGLIAGRPATGMFVPLALSGDNELQIEKLLAYELGHRWRTGDGFTFATSLFYNDYRRLIGVPPTIVGTFSDQARGETYGVEFHASWQLTPGWRMDGVYSRLGTEIHGPVLPFEEDSTPKQLAYVRSAIDIGDGLEFNAALYHVDRIPQNSIDSYNRLDVGLSWRPRADLELAVWGQNLTESEHAENSGALVPRSVHAQLTWRMR